MKPALQVPSSEIAPDRTPFFGRRREHAILQGELEAGTRLLTLTSPSGMGKTRLARKLLRESLPSHTLGKSWLCDVSACRTRMDLEATIARTMGVERESGTELAHAIAARGRMLLVLDNLDHAAREAEQLLGDWLDGCPELQILVTSIVPPGIEGEVRFELGPLEVDDAVDLYLERAHRAWGGKTFSEAERRAIGELVRRLDRIPLAIELAAARVRVLPPRALLERIGERFDLLQSGRPGRHGSLWEALSLTWELLSEEERILLCRTSVFSGGFTLEAAEAVLRIGEGGASLFGALDGLRGKALLQLDEGATSRFSLIECVREFAAIELERSGLGEESRSRHASFFLAAGEQHAERSAGREPLPSIHWLQAERENLLAVHRAYLVDDPHIAARAGLVLAEVIELAGVPARDDEFIASTLEASRRTGDPSLLARALRIRAGASTWDGKVEEARAALHEGLELARAQGDEMEEGRLLTVSGWLRTRMNELEAARGDLERAIAIAIEIGEPILEGTALFHLGRVEAACGVLDACDGYLDRAQAIFRRCGPLRLECLVQIARGVVLGNQGRFDEAREADLEAVEVSRVMGSRRLETQALLSLWGKEVARGRTDDAEAYFQEALERERCNGNRDFEAMILSNLGEIALLRREPELALRELRQGLRISSVDELSRAELLWMMAIADAMLGRTAGAREKLAEAVSFLEKVAGRGGPVLSTALLELAEARALDREVDADKIAYLEGCARERLASLSARRTGNWVLGHRILEQALHGSEPRDAPAGIEAESEAIAPDRLLIGPDAAWFEVGGIRKDLRSRGAVRRILRALVEQRLSAAGDGLSQEDLYAIGWEDEQVQFDAARTRVYSAVWILRTLGLERILVRHASGYVLDPDFPVALAES